MSFKHFGNELSASAPGLFISSLKRLNFILQKIFFVTGNIANFLRIIINYEKTFNDF